MKPISQTTLKLYWNHAKKYKWSLFFIFMSQTVLIIGGQVLIPLFLKDLFDVLTNFNGINRADAFSQLFDFWIIVSVLDVVSYGVFGRIFDFTITYFGTSLIKDLSTFCFQKIQNHSYSFFTNNFVGSLVSKTHRFVYGFQRMVDIILFNFFSNIIRFAFSIAILFYFIPLVGWIITCWILIYFGVVFWATKKWKIPQSRKASAEQSKYTAALADTITNATAIKMFARNEWENSRFNKVVNNLVTAQKQTWNCSNYLNIFQALFMSVLEATVLFIMIKLWIASQISVGTIVMIQTYTMSIYMNLWDIGRIIRNFYEALADSEEMTQIINKTPDILDPKDPKKCKIKKGSIEFKNVQFSYEKDETKIFKKFNFQIQAGQKIGLVGESGAGKTTITKLLLRFADVDSGDILIDNQSIYEITQEDLRRNIAFVPQDPILFHRTLFENIQYGNQKVKESEIFETAKKAHAHEFILKTPQKYETLVGERGIKLSGGERQRIAIARAMLKDSPILILDEATSSLDSHSEKLIQESLDILMKNRTTIVIAHRLSTLKKMDKICVMDEGKIIEFDTHENLIKNKGKYAELWEHQVGGFLPDKNETAQKEKIDISLKDLEEHLEE